MIPRFAEQILGARLATSPAVVLLGPRQVGKTTLARALAAELAACSIAAYRRKTVAE